MERIRLLWENRGCDGWVPFLVRYDGYSAVGGGQDVRLETNTVIERWYILKIHVESNEGWSVANAQTVGDT